MIHRFIDLLKGYGIPYSYGPSNYNIEITDPSGGGAHTDVTSPGAASVQTPVMNHAGTRLTYLKNNAGNYNMRAINPDGSGDALVRSGYVRYSDWSPDDSQIVFTVYDTGDDDTIRIMDADGSNESVLYTSSGGVEVMRPLFNFDGSKIAFMERISGSNGKIRCMNADGSSVADVVATGVKYIANNAFSWHPSANVIAYGDGQVNGKFRKINSDGTGGTDLETQLNSIEAYGTRWMWASDGSAIFPEIYQGSTRWKIYSSPASGGGGSALSPQFQVVDRPTFVFSDRIYGLTYIEPVFSGTNFSSVALDGSDRRVEDTSDAANILLELFA